MISFNTYINDKFSLVSEGNLAGKAFEQNVCNAVNLLFDKFDHIEAFTIDQMFKDSSLDDTELEGRAEDYSDVCVQNNKNGKQVFIECKEQFNANICNMKFILNDDMSLSFVRGQGHHVVKNELIDRLAVDLMNTDSWKAFVKFLITRNELLDYHSPADFYFSRQHATQSLVKKLAKSVNREVDTYKTTAHVIPNGNFAPTTLACWVLALCWKLDKANLTHTYDITTVDVDYMPQLVLNHYLKDKKVPAPYIQLADDLYIFDKNDNPLMLKAADDDITLFPEQLAGRYTLKFTPRISDVDNLKCYFDARSSIMQKPLLSNASLLSKSRFPYIDLSK